MARKTLLGKAVVHGAGACLLGAALVCAGVAGAASNPSPEMRTPARGEVPALLLPGQEGFAFSLLGSIEVRTAVHRYKRQWDDLLARVKAERKRYEACDADADCAPEFEAWRALLARLEGLPRKEQMERANREINRLVEYTDDEKAFRARDYWAAPLEALARGGDCEDYAILKFVTLLQLGFNSDQLRLTIVRNRARNVMHAVLAVTLDGKTYILDNLNNHAVEQHYVLKYVPLYSVSLDAQWVHIVTSQIRARFVTHVMRQQEQAEELASRPVTNAEEKPQAFAGVRDDGIRLVGSYAAGWT